MQGEITMRECLLACLPWLSPDSGGTVRHSAENGRFIGGAEPERQKEPQERIEQCLRCPYPECRNCMSEKKKKPKPEDLLLRKCGEGD